LEPDKSFDLKLHKLAVTLGKTLRAKLALPAKLTACAADLKLLLLNPTLTNTA
jgi:transposase